MEEKLVPAHIFFVKWFIRIRWVAIVILVGSNFIVNHLLGIYVQEKAVYILASVLFVLNIIHRIILGRLKKEKGSKVVKKIKQDIHLQIITDLIILTLIIHFSGGVENPLILFYFFHLIIASSIFSAFQSYIYAAFAIVLAALLGLLECYGVIPHYQLEGLVGHDLYKSVFYVFGAGFIFACTAVLIVGLSHMIIHRSIKSEETYVRTNMELENKDKLKNEYVLRVTHDIKGHIAAILSCLEVVRSKATGPLNDVQEEFANRAFERTEILSGFTKDLLNLTRKRLKHDSEFEEFMLKDLIDKVLAQVQMLMKDKAINFSFYIDKSVQAITGNPFTIEELYSNLLMNAIKYTPRNGRIELTVKNRINHIVTEISDSGIGIPKEELTKVFDEFYRASNVPRDIKTGSGLGLSIVKQIIKDHNGQIWVTSEPGVWTKFTFLLPKSPSVSS
jgi:signal transduction histidine kinase